MNDNYFTIDEIKERTNLSMDFIRRCIKFFKQELSPHIMKGEFNALKFDSNAVAIFDKIMQYKSEGFTLPVIKDKLKLPTKHIQNDQDTASETLPNTTDGLIIKTLLNEVKEGRTGLVTIQNQLTKVYETLIEKEKVIEVQKFQLNLLTDGKTLEEARSEQSKKEQLIRDKENKLLQLETSLKEKESELLKVKEEKGREVLLVQNQVVSKEGELRSVKTELEFTSKELDRIKQEKKAKEEADLKAIELEKARVLDLSLKKQSLLKELQDLEGKWFAGKKRQDLLKQLQDL